MKILTSIFILTFGVVAFGFAQGQEKRNPTLQELINFQPQIGEIIATVDFDKKDTLKLDSGIVFTPEEFFLDREMYAYPTPSQNLEMPFYRLPDPQSRMPIKEFDNSIHYTILIKKYR